MRATLENKSGQIRSPAETSGTIRPAQLPPCPRVTGRAAEFTALDDAFARHRKGALAPVIALTGQAGVGKTTLVKAWAHRVARHFESVFFADMRGYAADGARTDPHEVVDDVLRGMGTSPSEIPVSASRRAALLRTTLAGTRTLLVLDNVADPEHVSPLVPAERGCLVLATSRRRLVAPTARYGVHHLHLGPLSSDDGVDLLREVVGTDRVDSDIGAARRIVELCGGLPLGVRVAAERVASGRWPLAAIAEELAGPSRLEVLSVNAGDLLRSVFSWSLRGLDEEVTRLFELASLHPGEEFGLGAAAALANRDPQVTAAMLDVLSDVHLLEEVTAGRYRFHDLVRSYAEERARTGHGCQVAVRRVLDWYARVTTAACRALSRSHGSPVDSMAPAGLPAFDEGMAARWLEVELPNLAAVTRKAAAIGVGPVAFGVPAALTDVLYWRNAWSLWENPLRTSLLEAQRVGDLAAQGALLNSLGNARLKQELPTEAEDCFSRSLACWKLADDHFGQLWPLFGLGRVRQATGDHLGAEKWYSRAQALAAELEDRRAWAIASAYLGDAQRLRGEHEEAARNIDIAIDVLRRLGYPQSESCALTMRSDVCRDQGDERGRFDHLRRALAASEQAADFWGAAELHRKIGVAYLELGDRAQAVRAWESALRRFDELDDPRALMIRKELDSLDSLPNTTA